MIYSIGFGLFLVPKAASMFLTNSLHAPYWFGGVVSMIASTMFLILWTVGLRRSGEATYLSPSRIFHPGDEARLLARLQSVNRKLVRTGMKQLATLGRFGPEQVGFGLLRRPIHRCIWPGVSELLPHGKFGNSPCIQNSCFI